MRAFDDLLILAGDLGHPEGLQRVALKINELKSELAAGHRRLSADELGGLNAALRTLGEAIFEMDRVVRRSLAERRPEQPDVG
jgi:hypothetical protein